MRASHETRLLVFSSSTKQIEIHSVDWNHLSYLGVDEVFVN